MVEFFAVERVIYERKGKFPEGQKKTNEQEMFKLLPILCEG